MSDHDGYREAFCTACQVIMELGQTLEEKETLHGFVSDLTSQVMDQTHALAIAHGQELGKKKQYQRNCEALRKKRAVAESALIVPAIPYREGETDNGYPLEKGTR